MVEIAIDNRMFHPSKLFVMKTILSILMPILIVLGSVTGALLYVNGVYYASAVITMTSIVSFACWITMMGEKKSTFS